MSIRSVAKAIILKDGKILLNRCHRADGKIYYDLLGGGQHPYESMEQAVVREVLEETGLTVWVERFVALAEEIYTDETLRKNYPAYTHRVMHIFLAGLTDEPKYEPTEKDLGMDTSIWISLDEVKLLEEIRPLRLKNSLEFILENTHPMWLGTEYLYWQE